MTCTQTHRHTHTHTRLTSYSTRPHVTSYQCHCTAANSSHPPSAHLFVCLYLSCSFYIASYIAFNYSNYCLFYLCNTHVINSCVLLYQSSLGLWLQNINELLLHHANNQDVEQWQLDRLRQQQTAGEDGDCYNSQALQCLKSK